MLAQLDRNERARFEAFYWQQHGCWIWNGTPTKEGYGKFYFRGKTYQAHRVAYLLEYGNYEPDFFVCHSCDNKLCVNPEHLYLGTHQDNMDDRTQKGRHHNLRITDKDIAEMKIAKESGMSQVQIAKLFGISTAHVSLLLNEKRRTVGGQL